MIEFLYSLPTSLYIVLICCSVFLFFMSAFFAYIYEEDKAFILFALSIWPISFCLTTLIFVYIFFGFAFDNIQTYINNNRAKPFEVQNTIAEECNDKFDVIVNRVDWATAGKISKIIEEQDLFISEIQPLPKFLISNKKLKAVRNTTPQRYKITFSCEEDKATFLLYWDHIK